MAEVIVGRIQPKHKGEWDIHTSYIHLDIVSYEGSSYMAIENNQNESPDASARWALIASKGDQGIQGQVGITSIEVSNTGDLLVTTN